MVIFLSVDCECRVASVKLLETGQGVSGGRNGQQTKLLLFTLADTLGNVVFIGTVTVIRLNKYR